MIQEMPDELKADLIVIGKLIEETCKKHGINNVSAWNTYNDGYMHLEADDYCIFRITADGEYHEINE